MSKMPSRITSQQLDLFSMVEKLHDACSTDRKPIPGSCNISALIRAGISDALKNCTLSRYHVAAKMSELLGREITKAQLDAFSAESKDGHRFPLEYLPAFIMATGDMSLMRMLAEQCNGYFIQNEDALKLELGKIADEERQLKERRRAIQTILKGDS
jgi:hypothetical protein